MAASWGEPGVQQTGKALILFVKPNGGWVTKRITKMSEAHLEAYAQYRPALIHNGRKPR